MSLKRQSHRPTGYGRPEPPPPDAHLASPHIKDVLTRAEELFGDSGQIVIYEPLPDGQASKGSLAAHVAS